MPIQLDIAGNFAKGQEAGITRRLSRQRERMNDIDIANENDKLLGRRDQVRQLEEVYGLQPFNFGETQTNSDPMYVKLARWWDMRRAMRANRAGQPPSPAMAGAPAAPMGEPGPAIPEDYTGDQMGVEPLGRRDGGRVGIPRFADEKKMVKLRNMAQKYADGGDVQDDSLASDLAPYAIPAWLGGKAIARGARALGPLARKAVGAAGDLAGLGGKAVPLVSLGATGADVAGTRTEDYRKRFGMETKDPSLLGDVAARTLGAASDLGDVLTFGLAGRYYRDKQQGIPATPSQAAAQPTAPAEQQGPPIPDTPDEAIAQQAKAKGAKMAQQAQEDNAPPGAIDFSKVNVPPSEIPSMNVGDWTNYRARAVRDMVMQGKSAQEAMESVTKMQQQGFQDYAQQALLHMQSGNMPAAASALRAAYQYFPNGSDVKVGIAKGKDGNPVLVGMGVDEKTGQPKGTPMVINPERLSVMIDNLTDPKAFEAWTKDWRAEEFSRLKYHEVEKPKAESEITYQSRMGRAALMTAEANQEKADKTGAKGRTQADFDRANSAFTKAVNEDAVMNPPKNSDPLSQRQHADRLISVMAQIYRRSNWEYPQVIEFVRSADSQGKLDEIAKKLGVQ